MSFKNKWFLPLYILFSLSSASFFIVEVACMPPNFMQGIFQKSSIVLLVMASYYQYKFSKQLSSLNSDGQCISPEMREKNELAKTKINKDQRLTVGMLIFGTVIAVFGSKWALWVKALIA